MSAPVIYVGCAGWNLPPHEKHRFPEAGSHLARYAACFSAVEINSSFIQAHRPETYARWVSVFCQISKDHNARAPSQKCQENADAIHRLG
jgi:hypothetical protein